MWLLIAFIAAQVGRALALDFSGNASQCVSHRGRPYSQEDCGKVAKAYGCIWANSSCVCANGGTYSKRSHKCWPPETEPTTTTTTRMVFSVAKNDSICRSNSGRAYDSYYCKEVAADFGCVWRGGACVCSNGGYYAKTTHTCYPPSGPDTTTSTILQPATSTPAPTESTCVSNKGHPYNRDNCLWFAKDYGCDWIDSVCSCTNHGVFSKTSKKCWPAPGSPTPPPCGDCHKPGPQGNVTLVTLLVVLLGGCASCTICMLPCTRRNVRYGCQRCRRRQLAIAGSSQPVLLNVEDDQIEVPAVQTSLEQNP